MLLELAKSENFLLGLVIFTSLACFSHCFRVNYIACNGSSTKLCPAILYYIPIEPKTIEETTSLFHVNSNSINRTLSGFAIAVSCGCPDYHDGFTYHVEYTVQPGDTWKVISSKFGFLVVEKPDKALIPSLNITLDILCGCSANMEILTYKIESGDTLFTICARFDANVEKTEKLNKLENRDLIFAREVLYIPEPGNPYLTEVVAEHANGFNLARIGAFPGVEVDVNTKVANFKMPVTGRVSQLKLDAMNRIGAAHNYYNVAVAAFFVIGLDIGISATTISSTVEKLKAPPHRMQIE